MRHATIPLICLYAACASDRSSSSGAAFERSATDICLAFDLPDIAKKLGWRAMKLARRSDGPSDSILCEYRTPQHPEHKLVAQFIPGPIDIDLVLGSGRTFDVLDLPDGRVWAKSEMGTATSKVVFAASGLVISTTLDGMVSPPGMMKLATVTLVIAKSLPADPSALMVRPPKS